MNEAVSAERDVLPRVREAFPPAGGVFARPRRVAIAAIVALAGLGWIYLALMVAGLAGEGRASALGPGMGLFDLWLGWDGDGLGRLILEAICRPTFGAASTAGMAADIALVVLMWGAMALAMMLPSGGPMIVTYAEIAEAAARQAEKVASPLVLIAGYGAVWMGFSIVAAALQIALTRAAVLDPSFATASPLFSGAVFIGAGLYQFSALKHACVTLCQNPFPFFLANWSPHRRDVFRLGFRQGLYCLGCCWAAMLVMFAVGVMNVVWMAALGMVMASEKVATTTRLSRAIGVVFLAIGATFLAISIAAQWPV